MRAYYLLLGAIILARLADTSRFSMILSFPVMIGRWCENSILALSPYMQFKCHLKRVLLAHANTYSFRLIALHEIKEQIYILILWKVIILPVRYAVHIMKRIDMNISMQSCYFFHRRAGQASTYISSPPPCIKRFAYKYKNYSFSSWFLCDALFALSGGCGIHLIEYCSSIMYCDAFIIIRRLSRFRLR